MQTLPLPFFGMLIVWLDVKLYLYLHYIKNCFTSADHIYGIHRAYGIHAFCVNSTTMSVMDGETYIHTEIFLRPPIRLIFIVVELLLHEVSFNLEITMYIETLVVTDLPL